MSERSQTNAFRYSDEQREAIIALAGRECVEYVWDLEDVGECNLFEILEAVCQSYIDTSKSFVPPSSEWEKAAKYLSVSAAIAKNHRDELALYEGRLIDSLEEATVLIERILKRGRRNTKAANAAKPSVSMVMRRFFDVWSVYLRRDLEGSEGAQSILFVRACALPLLGERTPTIGALRHHRNSARFRDGFRMVGGAGEGGHDDL